MSASHEPVPFEVYEAGVYLHGTKADLAVGDLLVSGRRSNFEPGRLMNYIYFTATLDAAVWGAELASGDGPGRIYRVEPTGEFEDDPNLTDKKFPGSASPNSAASSSTSTSPLAAPTLALSAVVDLFESVEDEVECEGEGEGADLV